MTDIEIGILLIEIFIGFIGVLILLDVAMNIFQRLFGKIRW